MKRLGCWSDRLGSDENITISSKKGIYRKTTCGSAEFESWNWSNVKMYRDDIPIGSECLLEKYCEHVFESCAMQTEMKWNVLDIYYSSSSVSQIYIWFCDFANGHTNIPLVYLFVCLWKGFWCISAGWTYFSSLAAAREP